MFTALTDIQLLPGKKVYFASDFHFGIPDYATSRKREQVICNWLNSIQHNAQHIFLLGDVFDAWMEYTWVVPKGHVRFLGKLAELSDKGIHIHMFIGNHDVWMRGYFEQELQIPVYKELRQVQINEKKIVMGHGDGVSTLEKKYRIMKAIIHHPVSQWIYRKLHPDWGLALADYFSRLGPKHKYEALTLKPANQEYQMLFANDCLKHTHYDYFIFGHRHIPYQVQLTQNSEILNVGDWLQFNTYAVFDGISMKLEKY